MDEQAGRADGPRVHGRSKRAFAPWADPAARPLVRFERVSKRFDDTAAVDALSLDIFPGEFFALLGPSGCGKTTLLRLLAGFETPSDGHVLLGGEVIDLVPPHRRPVNMMFQSYALFPHLNVERNVAFGLKQEGRPRGEIAARVAEMLALVKLQALARRKPHQLSGGERQRVALARALVKRPQVLLLDEPLAALDKKLRAATQFELMELQARLGTTFVIVTHDQDEAMTVADRIAVMEHGRIAQVGTPVDIYEQPNSRYVASFVGDVNLIEGRLTASASGRASIDSRAGTLVIAQQLDAPAGSTVWVALRPEKLRIATAPPAGTTEHFPEKVGTGFPKENATNQESRVLSGSVELESALENCVAGRVLDIGYLGNVSLYQVRLDDGTVLKAQVPNLTRHVERPIGWDDRVWLSWTPDAGVVLTH